MIPAFTYSGAPLDPSGQEARSLLQRELLKPEYRQDDVWSRLRDWLIETLLRGAQAASGASGLTLFFSLLLFLVLLLTLGFVLTRARRSVAARRERRIAVLDERHLTAADLRARARAAYDEGRYDDATLDAYRALTLGQIEAGRIDDQPGATAREVAEALATRYAAEGAALVERFHVAAGDFDLVAYGHRAATRGQADAMRALDEELGATRTGGRR